MKMRSITGLLAAALVAALATVAAADDAAEVRKAKREADDLVKRLGHTKDEAKRAELVARIDAIDIRGRLPALLQGLRTAMPRAQLVCVDRLAALKIPEVLPHFVGAATNPSTETNDEVRDAAHAAAVGADTDRARRWYEYVAVNDLAARRRAAIPRIGQIGSTESVPTLALVLEICTLDVRAQVARLRGFKTVPVNLGSAGNAATQVPIELPQIDLSEVQTSVQAASLREAAATKTASLAALKAIAKEDLGEDPAAWLAWYEKHRKPEPEPSAAPVAPKK